MSVVRPPGHVINTIRTLSGSQTIMNRQCEKFSRQLDLVLCRLRVKDAHILTDSVRNENILNVNYNHYNRIYTGGVLTTVETVCINIHNYTQALLHNKTANKNSALIPGLRSSLAWLGIGKTL